MKRLFAYMMILFAFASCVREDVTLREAFQGEGGIYAVRGNQPLFVFDENTCQWSYDAEAKIFKIFDDNLSEWLVMDCKGASLVQGNSFTANLSWTTARGDSQLWGVPFQLMKIDDGLYYFWSSNHNIALRLRAQ